MPTADSGSPFLAFSDLLTGYRGSAVLMLAHESGLFDLLAPQGGFAEEICADIGWDLEYGRRFLDCLCQLGLLGKEENRYGLSPEAKPYLERHSPHSLRRTLDFEQQLILSWGQLDATLKAGGRIFAAGDKCPEELRQARIRYLGAMDEAAGVRAAEVWQCCPGLPLSGTMLDLGRGFRRIYRRISAAQPRLVGHFLRPAGDHRLRGTPSPSDPLAGAHHLVRLQFVGRGTFGFGPHPGPEL